MLNKINFTPTLVCTFKCIGGFKAKKQGIVSSSGEENLKGRSNHIICK